MHKISIIAALAGVSLLFVGCGVSASQTDDAGHGSNTPSASATPTAGESSDAGGAQSAQETATDTVAKFGSAYVYQDGLSVTVSAPKAFEPSEYAAGTDNFKHFVSFEVRIVNKTGKPWDPSLFSATVQSDNEEGEEVFDDGLEGAPQTKLLNGRETKFAVAYGVANPKDIVMEVNPDMIDHDAVMFQS
ncbi:MAG: hypothetical protein LKI24_12670 [Acidipropionibacterium sp.]|jgi:hypothetical protein|nr:hypothetical protein [Acidipropionibacterium sp.]